MAMRAIALALLAVSMIGAVLGARLPDVATTSAQSQPPATLRNQRGLQLLAATDAGQPRLRVVLPGQETSDRSIEVLVPEHVTAVRNGAATAEQLFLPRPGSPPERPVWRASGNSLEYTLKLSGDVDMTASAMLEDDGVRFRYVLTNRSSIAYSMITAVTDPRLTGRFHDVRLERTYVHHADGFDLLASEVPARLTLPLDRWLPARVLASFSWPVPAQRLEKRDDGITYYNKGRAVDVPFIVTRSTDSEWSVASVARAPGNVWSNPVLTCQHVDPQAPLPNGQQAVIEVKLLVLRGSIDEAFERAVRERRSMK